MPCNAVYHTFCSATAFTPAKMSVAIVRSCLALDRSFTNAPARYCAITYSRHCRVSLAPAALGLLLREPTWCRRPRKVLRTFFWAGLDWEWGRVQETANG